MSRRNKKRVTDRENYEFVSERMKNERNPNIDAFGALKFGMRVRQKGLFMRLQTDFTSEELSGANSLI